MLYKEVIAVFCKNRRNANKGTWWYIQNVPQNRCLTCPCYDMDHVGKKKAVSLFIPLYQLLNPNKHFLLNRAV